MQQKPFLYYGVLPPLLQIFLPAERLKRFFSKSTPRLLFRGNKGKCIKGSQQLKPLFQQHRQAAIQCRNRICKDCLAMGGEGKKVGQNHGLGLQY